MPILNKSWFVFLSITLCLVLRIKHEITFPLLDSDYAVQIEAAKNFSEGHGFSNQKVEGSDITFKKYLPLKKWPVGYPIAVWLCHFFTSDFVWAQVLLQALAIVLFAFSFKKMMDYFEVKPVIQVLVFGWMAISPTPFSYLGTSDLLTSGLFLFSIYFLFKGLEVGKINSYYFFLTGMLSFLSAAFRFACIPNLIILPFFLLLLFIFQRNKKYLVSSFFLLTISGLFTFIFYKIFPIDSSRTNFMKNLSEFNFYYKNLEWFDPFPIKAFVFTRPFEFRFPNNVFFLFSYRLAMLLGSVLLLFFILRYFVKREQGKGLLDIFRKESSRARLYQVFLCAFLVIVAFLSLQSLTVPVEHNSFGPPWMPPLWTFVYSTRYFILLMTLVLFMGIIWLNDKLEWKNNGKIFRFGFPLIVYCSLFLYSLFYFVFINYQLYSSRGNGGGSEWNNWKDEFSMISMIKEDRVKDPSSVISLTSSARKNYNAPILLLADGNYCQDYSSIISGNFNYRAGNNILYVYTPKDFQEKAHQKLFDKGELIDRMELTKGKLYKIKLK